MISVSLDCGANVKYTLRSSTLDDTNFRVITDNQHLHTIFRTTFNILVVYIDNGSTLALWHESGKLIIPHIFVITLLTSSCYYKNSLNSFFVIFRCNKCVYILIENVLVWNNRQEWKRTALKPIKSLFSVLISLVVYILIEAIEHRRSPIYNQQIQLKIWSFSGVLHLTNRFIFENERDFMNKSHEQSHAW